MCSAAFATIPQRPPAPAASATPTSASCIPPERDSALVEDREVRLEPLDRNAADDVAFDDLAHVLDLDLLVPDIVGVHHHGGADLADLHAAGLVDADLGFEAMLGDHTLELLQDLEGAAGAARPARMLRRALIDADKDVSIETHGAKIGVLSELCCLFGRPFQEAGFAAVGDAFFVKPGELNHNSHVMEFCKSHHSTPTFIDVHKLGP